MKRRFKRTLSTILCSALMLGSVPIISVQAKEYNFTQKGTLVISPESIIQVVREEENYLLLGSSLFYKDRIYEVDKEPDEEEMEKWFSEGKTYTLVKGETPYIIRITKTDDKFTAVKLDVKPEISYVMDTVKGIICDYETGQEIQKLGTVIVGAIDTGIARDYLTWYYTGENIFISEASVGSDITIVTKDITSNEVIGDIDDNGVLDLTDLTNLSLYLIGDKEFTDDMKAIADMTKDDAVNLADLATMKQYIMNAL